MEAFQKSLAVFVVASLSSLRIEIVCHSNCLYLGGMTFGRKRDFDWVSLMNLHKFNLKLVETAK